MDEFQSNRIVVEARRWIGTPFHHRAGLRGVGCDCLGLVLGVWRAAGGRADIAVPPYSPAWGGYGGGEPLLAGLTAALRPLGGVPPAAGDVIAMRMAEDGPVRHLGIVTGTGGRASFVHAYARRGVVESALSPHWQRKVAAAFRFPAGD